MPVRTKLTLELYRIAIKKLNGDETKLSEYEGKVLLIVNVASRCGFTPQYEGLQALHRKYQSKGLCVLAIPCNDFADQEPGSEIEIREFCDHKYGITFDVFEKVKIRGNSPHRLYNFLEVQLIPAVSTNVLKAKLFEGYTSLMFWFKEGRFPRIGEIRWNFHKFVIDRKGHLVGHFSSDCEPSSPQITACIERELEKQ